MINTSGVYKKYISEEGYLLLHNKEKKKAYEINLGLKTVSFRKVLRRFPYKPFKNNRFERKYQDQLRKSYHSKKDKSYAYFSYQLMRTLTKITQSRLGGKTHVD
ncbi:hypothetical protein HS7_12380 [Sulfolobales archaeon HS-7]|nr:hypothetical protein HS7_12380 [Sulfolobales archaeon HS-7]